jgi:hypothetical protein
MTQQVELHKDVQKFSPEVQAMLQSLSPSQIAVFNAVYRKRRKDPVATLLLAFFLPPFDRVYLQDFVGAILKFITALGLYIWWIVDIVSATRRAYEYNEKIAIDIATQVKLTVDPNIPVNIPQEEDYPIITVLSVLAFLAVLAAICVAIVKFLSVP